VNGVRSSLGIDRSDTTCTGNGKNVRARSPDVPRKHQLAFGKTFARDRYGHVVAETLSPRARTVSINDATAGNRGRAARSTVPPRTGELKNGTGKKFSGRERR